MLLSGFTFIRNARKYDFPVVECIESMLPLVDELVVNAGRSEDDTAAMLAAIRSPKLRILESVWDDSRTEKGLVLSQQTNLALEACRGGWALYLQADEALHEAEHARIREAIEKEDAAKDPVDGFRFRYLHFYGGYTMIERRWNWYPSEIRVLRRASGARSVGDAQSFRGPAGTTLRTRLLDAHVFHYGHARAPEAMARKIHYFHRFWHGDGHGIIVKQAYSLRPRDVTWYWGGHPGPYIPRVIEGTNWSPRPAQVAGRFLQRVVIVCDDGTRGLAAAIESGLRAATRGTLTVQIVRGPTEWARAWLKGLGSRRRRASSAVVDLRAERRNLASLARFGLEAALGFGWRVAHAPGGKLSARKARLYNVASWGRHEVPSEGFVVPESEYANQLLRWLGVDPV